MAEGHLFPALQLTRKGVKDQNVPGVLTAEETTATKAEVGTAISQRTSPMDTGRPYWPARERSGMKG